MSVMNMCPGAWVITTGGFAFSTAACGVTPQGQNHGHLTRPDFHWITVVGLHHVLYADFFRLSNLHGAPWTLGIFAVMS